MANPKKSSISLAPFAGPPISAASHTGRGHGRATQATVARQAGVTPMTVSRFLKAPRLVRADTAARIESAMVETGYMPNKHAGMLASGRSNIVAAIIPSIASSIFAETVQGLSDTLQQRGLEVLLACTNYSLEREEEQIRAVLGWSPSALVVTGRRHSPNALALMHGARHGGTPVLEIWDHDPRDKQFVQIGFSHRAVGAMMARHLLARGYRDLAYVDSGVAEDFRAHERGEAFVRVATKADARARVVQAPRSEPMAAGRAALLGMCAAGLPRAAAFANDQLAAGAFLEAAAQRIDVPGTIALLGFGDFPISSQLGAGLSTVSVGRYEIGSVCATQLLAMLLSAEQGRPPGLAHAVVQPRLVRREST